MFIMMNMQKYKIFYRIAKKEQKVARLLFIITPRRAKHARRVCAFIIASEK